ncbi:MAG TPA: hypothetical protein VG028_00135 [Terriglobia bacterium]|nr:hypothetical protein [Terriglobia bacterium]
MTAPTASIAPMSVLDTRLNICTVLATNAAHHDVIVNLDPRGIASKEKNHAER